MNPGGVINANDAECSVRQHTVRPDLSYSNDGEGMRMVDEVGEKNMAMSGSTGKVGNQMVGEVVGAIPRVKDNEGTLDATLVSPKVGINAEKDAPFASHSCIPALPASPAMVACALPSYAVPHRPWQNGRSPMDNTT